MHEPVFRQGRQVGLARQSPPQPANCVLHAALLPGRVSIAEEGLYTQLVELVMVCELGTVVEGDRPSPFRRELTQNLGHSGGYGNGRLARRSQGYEDARVAFVHGQHRMSIDSEQHQVSLPVPRSATVIGAVRALGDGTTLSHEGSRATPSAASPTSLRLGIGKVVAPAVILLTSHLAVDEPVYALVGDDSIT